MSVASEPYVTRATKALIRRKKQQFTKKDAHVIQRTALNWQMMSLLSILFTAASDRPHQLSSTNIQIQEPLRRPTLCEIILGTFKRVIAMTLVILGNITTIGSGVSLKRKVIVGCDEREQRRLFVYSNSRVASDVKGIQAPGVP